MPGALQTQQTLESLVRTTQGQEDVWIPAQVSNPASRCLPEQHFNVLVRDSQAFTYLGHYRSKESNAICKLAFVVDHPTAGKNPEAELIPRSGRRIMAFTVGLGACTSHEDMRQISIVHVAKRTQSKLARKEIKSQER